MTPALLSHVALLLPSVQRAAECLQPFGFHIGVAEVWEGEGTLEIYVGDPKLHMSTLLLMEAVKEGAYSRALKKRGAGLHHIAVEVLDLELYLDELAGSGWLLHPKSIKTIRNYGTAYLARPGIPTLIEVQQRERLSTASPFITQICLPDLSKEQLQMFQSLGLSQVMPSSDSHFELTANGKIVRFRDLV